MTGDLDVLQSVEIRGDPFAPVVIVGDGTDRVLSIGTSGSVTVSNLTITGGRSISSGGGLRAVGGVFEFRNLTILDNTTQLADGGGVFLAAARSALLESCTVVSNHAPLGRGGGIHATAVFDLVQRVVLVNSTVAGNSADFGGGLYLFGTGEMSLIHLTIADNTTPLVFGDGIVGDLTNRTTLFNTLIANNSCGVIQGVLRSNGHNMEGPTATCFSALDGDPVGVPDLGLGPLADHGGPTMTYALLPGSPARDAGLDDDCPASDQRGQPRPVDGDFDGVARCDVGAFEAQLPVLASIPAMGPFGAAAFAALVLAGGIVVRRRSRR